MKISKQLKKLNNLNVKAEKCLTRDEARKIISKAIKVQSKISILKLFLSGFNSLISNN